MPTIERTRQFFEDYAVDFDALYGTRRSWLNRVVNPLLRKSMRLRYERTLAACQPLAGRTVLDVGCGPGHYSVALARRGAARVVGIDFADGMLEIAEAHASKAGAADRCEWLHTGFEDYSPDEVFDYVVLNGFMDYAPEPAAVVRRALALTARRAFFSFPASGGVLGWQRRQRYRNRCDLFLYERTEVAELFHGIDGVSIETIARDYFVQVDQGRRTSPPRA